RSEDGFCAERRRGLGSLAPLLLGVSLGGELRVATLAERQMEQDDAIAALVLLQKQRAAREFHVARVRADGENRARRFGRLLRGGGEGNARCRRREENPSGEHPISERVAVG